MEANFYGGLGAHRKRLQRKATWNRLEWTILEKKAIPSSRPEEEIAEITGAEIGKKGEAKVAEILIRVPGFIKLYSG